MTLILLDKDMLECAVCLETFDETCKMLPCQHTFCTKCLKSIYDSNKQLHCPKCRILIETQVDELPRNYFLLNLIEKRKTKEHEEFDHLYDTESLQMQIALKNSEKEMFKTPEMNFFSQKEKLEYELALLNSKEEVRMQNENLENYDLKELMSYIVSEVENATNKNNLQSTNADVETELKTVSETHNHDDFVMALISEFHNFSVSLCPQNLKETSSNLYELLVRIKKILVTFSNEETFNNTTLLDLQKYNEIIQKYYHALIEYYKEICCSDDQSGDSIARPTETPNVDIINSGEGDSMSGIVSEENRQLAYGIQLSHQFCTANDEGALMELILKRSEITSTIEKHKNSIEIFKEKIELRIALLLSNY